jgi:hypothetical protein
MISSKRGVTFWPTTYNTTCKHSCFSWSNSLVPNSTTHIELLWECECDDELREEWHVGIEKVTAGGKCRLLDTWQACWGGGRYHEMLYNWWVTFGSLYLLTLGSPLFKSIKLNRIELFYWFYLFLGINLVYLLAHTLNLSYLYG